MCRFGCFGCLHSTICKLVCKVIKLKVCEDNMNMKALLIILLFIVSFSLHTVLCQNKYILNCKKALLEKSLDIAFTQVGITERTGKNDGDVEKYLLSVGLRKGFPYCAAGQYYCFIVAADILRLSYREIPIKRTGIANEIFNSAAAMGEKIEYSLRKHDLIVWRVLNGSSGHIERVCKVIKAGWVLTIGFNTSSGETGTQRDGQGVFLRKRNIFHPLGRMAIRGIIGFKTM